MTWIVCFLLSAWVHAKITVLPVSPHTAVTSGSTSIFYYAATGAVSPNGFISNGFTQYDLSNGGSSGIRNRGNLIWLDIKSDTKFTIPAGQALVLSLTANSNTSSVAVPFPIAAAGIGSATPDNCSTSNGNCIVTSTQPDSKFWMANYSQLQTVRVGFYPLDICYFVDWVKGSGSPSTTEFAEGCASNSSVLGSNTSGTIIVTASIYLGTVATVSDGAPTYAVAGSAETATFTLNFQQLSPTYSCATPMSNTYFPGDAGILLDGSKFNYARASGGAPVNAIVVAGKKDAMPTMDSGYGSNDIVQYPATGIESFVSGFTNTTDGSDNKYNVAFSVRDASGMIANFNTTTCVLNNVQTSEIQTFLKNSNCFIASSAFRDPVAIPVMILREFRDQYLLRFEWGKSLVRWYYMHSPALAQWLWFHPEFRYVVIAALSPFILFSIIALHPALVFVVVIGVALIKLQRKQRWGQFR